MALINNIIPESSRDITLYKIGEILKLELENQKTLQGLTDPIQVYNSRMHRFNHSEELMINVLVDNFDGNIYNAASTQGETTYFVDVHSSSTETSDNLGGLNSSIKLNKYVGLIQYILSSPEYRILDLPQGVISGVYIRQIQFYNGDPNGSEFVKEARIYVTCKVNNSYALENGITLEGNDTELKLCETDLGYKYEFNNN